MDRDPVNSRAFRSLGYDRDLEILEVEFNNGRVYRYYSVPEFLFQGFRIAPSKGEYFNKRINGRFRDEEVK